jgi:hypothetical protein
LACWCYPFSRFAWWHFGGNSLVAAFVAGTEFTATASWIDEAESALDRT